MSLPVDIPGSRLNDDDAHHARHSPTVARPVDPNDPAHRERQRDMDVDMAMHLSRARRETISVSGPSPVTSPPILAMSSSDLGVTGFSTTEQHDLDLAKGEIDDEDVLDISESPGQVREEEPLSTPEDRLFPSLTPGTLLNMDIRGGQDPALLVTSQQQQQQQQQPPPHIPQHHHHPPSLNHGLPTYQDTSASSYHFDFSSMETFAAEQKRELGLTSPASPRFSLSQLRPSATLNKSRATVADDDTIIPPNSSPGAGTSSDIPPPKSFARQRRLSHSHRPRHRKGIGGRLALFEAGSSSDGRFGSLFNTGNGPSLDDSGVVAPGPSTGGTGGILNTGHDRPYRFSFYSNALGATIHARSLGELPMEGQTFSDLFHDVPAPGQSRSKASHGKPPGSEGYFPQYDKWSDESSTWWLDILSPTDEEMKMLSKVFGIHPLTTEDILMEEAREKIELFRNYYLVCFRSFEQDPYSPTYLEPLNMYIIVFREGTISFHFRQTPHPQSVRRRIKQLKDYISVTSDWISYALIDDITDAFGPLIQSIEYEVDSIDELVLILKEAEQSDMLRRIGTCRKKVMGLLRLMGNKADVVKGLAKRCNENWRVAPTSDIGLYLSDIQDHLITMTQNLNHYEKILSRSHSNYLAQISIEITDANNQINDVLSKLTALGTVLIPMNLVTGLWGMNVHVPGEGVGGYYWFGGIISVLVAFACMGGFVTYKFMVRR